MESPSGTNFSFHWRPYASDLSRQLRRGISADLVVLCAGAWDSLEGTDLALFSDTLQEGGQRDDWGPRRVVALSPTATVDRFLTEAKRPRMEDAELEAFRNAFVAWAEVAGVDAIVDGHRFTAHEALVAHTDDGIHYGRAVCVASVAGDVGSHSRLL